MVELADVVIAEATYASIGLGIELQIANERGIPIVIAYKADPGGAAPPARYVNPDGVSHDLQIGEGYVSLMALGLPGLFSTVGYLEPDDLVTRALDAIAMLDNS